MSVQWLALISTQRPYRGVRLQDQAVVNIKLWFQGVPLSTERERRFRSALTIQNHSAHFKRTFFKCFEKYEHANVNYFSLSRTSSLPSLWNSRKDWGKIRPLHPSLSLTSSSIPVLPAAHVTQLSKSAPTLLDPLLDASVLLQARANIHNSKY